MDLESPTTGPMGSLGSHDATRLAGSILAGVASSSITGSYYPSERFESIAREQHLDHAMQLSTGSKPSGWVSTGIRYCDALEQRGLLLGDGAGSYKITPLGSQIAHDHQGAGLDISATFRQPAPQDNVEPASPTLLGQMAQKLALWRHSKTADSTHAPKPDTPR
jgi:hypothetical protein